MEKIDFNASVQYDDLIGTVAADRGDRNSLELWLTEQNYLEEGELLAGLKLSFWENHGKEIDEPVNLSIFLSSEENLEALRAKVDSGSPLKVRRIETRMTLSKFSSFFKRLEIALSPRKGHQIFEGLLDDKEIQYDESSS